MSACFSRVRQLDAGRTRWWYEKLQLAGRVKDKADRAGNAFRLGHLSEVSLRGVDAEGYDGTGVLIFGQDEPASGVDSKVAGLFAAGRKIPNRVQCTLIGNAKDSDAVMAPVGGVEASAGPMKRDFSSVIPAAEVLGECGSYLGIVEETLLWIIREGGNRGIQLADDEDKAADERKSGVARASSGSKLGEWWIVGCEGAFGGIEAIAQDCVEAEVRDKDKAIVWRRFNPMGVWSFLALFVGAEGAGVLDRGGVFAQFAVGKNWKDD